MVLDGLAVELEVQPKRRRLDAVERFYAALIETHRQDIIVTATTLEPAPELGAVRKAAELVQERHAMLTALLVREDGEQDMHFAFGSHPPVEVRELSGSVEEAVAQELDDIPQGTECAWRIGLSGPHLLITYHHSFLDGWSVMRLLRELLLHMAGLVLPPVSALPSRAPPPELDCNPFEVLTRGVLSDCVQSVMERVIMYASRTPLGKFPDDVNWTPEPLASLYTPLHAAVLLNKRRAVEELLEAGVDPARRDSLGCTAKDWAEKLQWQDLNTLLEAASVEQPFPLAGAWVNSDGVPVILHSDATGTAFFHEMRANLRIVSRSIRQTGVYFVAITFYKNIWNPGQLLYGHLSVATDRKSFGLCHNGQSPGMVEVFKPVDVEYAQRWHPSLQGGQLQTGEAIAAKSEPNLTQHVWRAMPAEALALLRQRCHDEQTSVHGALGVALPAAVRTLVGEECPDWFSTIIQARAAYGLDDGAMGCFTTWVSTSDSDVGRDPSSRASFWEQARAYRQLIEEKRAQKQHLTAPEREVIDPNAANSYLNFVKQKRELRARLEKELQAGTREGLVILLSNRGAFSVATECHSVLGQRVVAPRPTTSNQVLVNVCTIDGVLNLSLSAFGYFGDTERLSQLVDAILAELLDAAYARGGWNPG